MSSTSSADVEMVETAGAKRMVAGDRMAGELRVARQEIRNSVRQVASPTIM